MILGPIRATGGEKARQSDTVFSASYLNIARRDFTALTGGVMLSANSWKDNSFLALSANAKNYRDLSLSYQWMVNGPNLPGRIRIQYSNNYGWSWRDLDNDAGIIDCSNAEINTLYENTLRFPTPTNPKGNVRIRFAAEAGGILNDGSSTFAVGEIKLYGTSLTGAD